MRHFTAVLLLVSACAYPDLTLRVDPETRYVHIACAIPSEAPDVVNVICEWSAPDTEAWHPAKVTPLLSETGLALASPEDWAQWMAGKLVERRAAGLTRTVVFNPYPDAQQNGRVDCLFRVTLQSDDGKTLAQSQCRIQADNTDVVYIEYWASVQQAAQLQQGWAFKTAVEGATCANALFGESPPDKPLDPLSYVLDLKGIYAVFVSTPAGHGVRLRLTGDERADTIAGRASEEVLWRWATMDRQSLVIAQGHGYKGYSAAGLDYMKLVPLSPKEAAARDAQFGEPDALVAGYFEPYSWAFVEDIRATLQHYEPLSAFKEARVDLVDIQLGRFGMKSVYESRKTDLLYYSTIGDPVAGDTQPHTDNVGKMQQYTNTLDAELRYARYLGLTAHANFGASNCYVGTPLQGDFSKQHPEWLRGHAVRFEVPEVRKYALELYREALEIGAPGVSIDFCRYPETVDKAETASTFLRELRALADEIAGGRNRPVSILVRFPAAGVRQCACFDYPAWAREGLVDYLCPSNIQGRHHHYDIRPYLDAVAGTRCTLLPCIDGLGWGPAMPGPFLWRVAQLYDAGVKGLYVYQADGRILGAPADRRCMRLLASRDAVRQWWARDAQLRPACSKGIFLPRSESPDGVWHGWERIRPWVEGVDFGPMDFYLDGNLVHRCDGQPYHLGSEDYAGDSIIPSGKHQLRVRVKDGDSWLEQEFAIEAK